MNDIKIYEQVAMKPGIRASEIAVNLDLTLATVSADLRSLVDAGDLVKRTEFGDQGRQCQVYALSDDFKASRTYKALMETMALTPATEQIPAQAGTVAHDQVQPAVAPPAAQQHGPSPSKVQLAMDCITRLGSATNDQLRDAMGLPPKTYVGAYLSSAVKAGKVMRDGDRWKLGADKDEAAPKVLDSVEKVGNIVVATKDASPIPQAVVDAVAAAAALVVVPVAAPPAPNLRCALWSDGTFELKSDGDTVALLTDGELKFVMGYLAQRAAA